MRQALNVGAAPGDHTGDGARVGSQKINANFSELYSVLGGDTPGFASGALTLGGGAGNPLQVDATKLFWDVSNHRLGVGTNSPQYDLEVVGLATMRNSGTYSWTGGTQPASSLVKMGLDDNGSGLLIVAPSNLNGEPFLSIHNRFTTTIFRISESGGVQIGGNSPLAVSQGFVGGGFLNTSGVVTRNVFSENNDVNNPAAVFTDQRASLVTERTFPLVWWSGGSAQPIISTMKGGLNAIDDGVRKGTAFYSYTGAALKENFRILDDQTLRLPNGATIWNNGVQVLGARRTGWTDQTAAASRADLGAAPTAGQLASFCRALYDDLKAHGIVGN